MRLAFGVAGLVVVILVGLLFLKPAAPRGVTLLVTPQGTSEHALGQLYAEHLERAGLEARLVEVGSTQEALANFSEIEGAVVSFVISGGEKTFADASVAEEFVSLGSIGLEPLWIFVRTDAEIASLEALESARVVVGLPGSKTNSVGHLILAELGLEEIGVESVSLSDVAESLSSGRADAALIVTGVRSELVGRLMEAEDIRPVSLELADAFVARYPWLTAVTYPRAAYDLRRRLPSEDLRLVAGSTNLVARRDTHEALVDLLLDIASEVNGEPGPFWRRGTFPNANGVSLPLDPAARRFFEQGPSKWRRWLPYRLATLVDRLTGVVIPTLTTFLLIFKLIPSALRFRSKLRMGELYGRLKALERTAADPKVKAGPLLAEADAIDRASASLWVPRSQTLAYLEMRQYMHDLRERLRDRDSR
jgi:TRAP-type uncharacterized transport system substrate-binding protein